MIRRMGAVVTALLVLPLAASAGRRGVVVRSVGAVSAPGLAGLAAGDTLAGWRNAGPRREAGGRFGDPFDWAVFVRDVAPRGEVVLVGRRGGARRTWTVGRGEWDVEVRATLPPEALAAFEAGAGYWGEERFPEAASVWEAAAQRARDRRRIVEAAWFLQRAAAARGRTGEVSREEADFLAAIRELDDAGRQEARALVQLAWASSLWRRSDLPAARRTFDEAIALVRQARGEGLWLASALLDEGALLDEMGENDAAAARYAQAEALCTRLAPGGLLEARLQTSMARLAWRRGDIAGQEAHLARAMADYEAAAPSGAGMADALVTYGLCRYDRGDLDAADLAFGRAAALGKNLGAGYNAGPALADQGMVRMDKGDLDAAEALYRDAIAVEESRAKGSMATAIVLNLLGISQWFRGDLAGAEATFRASLAIKERLVPRDVETAKGIMNLGALMKDRGDLGAAEELYRRAVERFRATAPGSTILAGAEYNLGILLSDEGRAEEAGGFLRGALAVMQAQAPDHLDTSEMLAGLAAVERERGNLAEAREMGHRAFAIAEGKAEGGPAAVEALLFLGSLSAGTGEPAEAEGFLRKALGIVEAATPDGLLAASVHTQLGALHRGRREYAEAERELGRSLEILRARAPGSERLVEALYEMGLTLRAEGRREEAIARLREAVAAVEALRGRVGGAQDRRAGFAAQYRHVFQALMELLVEAGRAEEAYGVLERSRAKALLAMLAERDLAFEADLPPELDRERRTAEEALAAAQAALDSEGGSDKARARLLEARRRREAVAEKVRAANPGLAELQYPRPLDLAGARAVLPPGTLLLAYAVGEERSLLFAVGPGPSDFSVYPLPAGAAALGREVRRFDEIVRGRGAVESEAKRLGARLLSPAAREFARARRLLICPDGALHYLPFAALQAPGSRAGRYRPLVEALPIHQTLSATLYARLGRARAVREGEPAVGFGDPAYPAAADAAGLSGLPPAVRGLLERGLILTPLPATRAEVESLRALAPGASLWLGPEATEERAKALPRSAGVVHFACHGLVDERHPLESALCLTVPAAGGREDGLLHAWEIYEGVRVEADLVVLSACETAVGPEVGGEGLAGLSRAFQYAGARSVLASLWPVADRATADLMGRFYRHLREGLPKDEALRASQLELFRGQDPGASHPCAWAGFVLQGDPR